MKTLKKVCACVAAMLLVLSMGVIAFADDTSYTISITNTKANQTYTAYKIFDVQSYSGDENADPSTAKAVYTIKETDAFYTFVSTGDGASYVTLTAADASENASGMYYVTWKDSVDETTAAEFAKLAVKYAGDNGVAAAADPVTSNADNATVTIDVTASGAGYYVVNTSLGALASLNTTNPTAEIQEKNGVPNVTKTVLEGETYGESNTASIGDTVTFITKIEVAETATDYVLYDLLGEGFTLNADSIKVYTDENCTTELVSKLGSTIYTVTTENAGTYKPTSTSTEATASFKIAFEDGPWDGVTYDDNNEGAVYVKYTATLDDDAVPTYNSVSDTNYNKTYLTYGDNATATAEAYTKTYTYAFDLVKTDGYNVLLDGASFQLNDSDGNTVKFTKTDDGYRVDPDGKVEAIEVTNGKARIIGLDAGEYTLTETVTPDGYNRAADTTITVTYDASAPKVNGNELNATISGTSYTKGGVQVINKSGSLLPSTGGIGTTIFYIVGGCLVLGAVVLLITKKRMASQSEAE